MGCDIHLVVERLHKGKWVAVDTFNGHESGYGKGWTSPIARSRNYDRFARLAGVRGEGPEARGLPENASDTTKALCEKWGQDGHSHSWLTLEEAAKIWLETERYNDIGDFAKKYPGSFYFGIDPECDPEPHRIVFWFDN